MKSIEELTNKIFTGIEITQEQKGALMDLYYISYYKMIIELLTTISGDKKEYHQALNGFVALVTTSFSSQQKDTFEKIVHQEQNTILKTILSEFSKNLPQEIQEKIVANLEASVAR